MLHPHELLPANLEVSMFQVTEEIKGDRHGTVRRILYRYDSMRHRTAQYRIKYVFDSDLRNERGVILRFCILNSGLVSIRTIRSQKGDGFPHPHRCPTDESLGVNRSLWDLPVGTAII